MTESPTTSDEVVVERIVDAPVEQVWRMWTEADHFKNWYGPKGMTVPVAELDVRVGGKQLVCMEMQKPEGSMKMWTTGDYREIVPNERLVYTDSPADEHGNRVSPATYGMGDEHPMTTVVTLLLDGEGNRTRMTLRHAGVPAGAAGGWQQAFDKMAEYLAQSR